jgi:hypothetical protein
MDHFDLCYEFYQIHNVIHEMKTKYIMNVTNVNMNLQITGANIDLLQKLILQDLM